MLRNAVLAGLVGLLLVGCGTPQEKCSRALSREARTLDRLIEESRENLARGYRYETEVRDVSFGMSFCSRSWNLGVCLDNRPSNVRRPVAIEPEEERKKLDALTQKRARLDGAQCSADGRLLSEPAR